MTSSDHPKNSILMELTALSRTMMFSIDIIPVPTNEAVREMQNRLLGVESNVTNWQRRQNSNKIIPPWYPTTWNCSGRKTERCWTI